LSWDVFHKEAVGVSLVKRLIEHFEIGEKMRFLPAFSSCYYKKFCLAIDFLYKKANFLKKNYNPAVFPIGFVGFSF